MSVNDDAFVKEKTVRALTERMIGAVNALEFDPSMVGEATNAALSALASAGAANTDRAATETARDVALARVDVLEAPAKAVLDDIMGGDVTGLAGQVATFTTASIPAYGTTAPSRTEKWRAALKRVREGTGSATVLCIGDSTTWGNGATPGVDSYPAQLAQILNNELATTTAGLSIPPADGAPADPRWNFGAGWAHATWAWAGNAAYRGGPSSGPLTFTAAPIVDTCDVYYISTYGTAVGKVSVNGATAVDMPTETSGEPGITKATFTFPAAAGTVVSVLNGSAEGNLWIVGFDAYLSTEKAIRVGGAGVSGSAAESWMQTGAFTSLEAVRAYAADLTIIMLGINDSAYTSANDYESNMATLIKACKESGDVLLGSFAPSNPLYRDEALQREYGARLQKLAIRHGCVYTDVFSRWGSYDEATVKGWMVDNLHPSASGYADIARAYADTLETI